jgi:hypothetical protein
VFRVVLSIVDVGGDDGFGVRVEANADAEPWQAVGKARPRDWVSSSTTTISICV